MESFELYSIGKQLAYSWVQNYRGACRLRGLILKTISKVGVTSWSVYKWNICILKRDDTIISGSFLVTIFSKIKKLGLNDS